eukprot:gene17750-9422_t
MLNRRPIDDWTTPKPASARSSPSRNNSLMMIKKGIVKSGPKIGEEYTLEYPRKTSKEHAIDSSMNIINSKDESISFKNGSCQLDAFLPKASVHMISRSNPAVNENQSSNPASDGFWATMKPQCYGNAVTSAKNHIEYEPRSSNMTDQSKRSNYMEVHSSYGNATNYPISHDMRSVKHIENLGSLGAFHSSQNNPVTVRDRQVMQSHEKRYMDAESKGEAPVTSQYLQYQSQGSQYDIYQSVMQIKAIPSASSLAPVNSKDSISSDRSGKWDHVMNAKDDLIKQKDLVISRQKQTIEQLQFHIGDIEERINQNSYRLSAQRKDDEKSKEKFKEAEGHIAQLKAQLLHISTTKQEEVEKLQKKLGETEYELQKLEKGFKDVGRGQAKQIAELKQKIEERNETDKKLKKSIEVLQSDLKKERLSDTVSRYKEREKNGPITMEEFDEVKWDNERLKGECDRLKKLLVQKHKKMEKLHQESQATLKALEERLGQEENTVNVLRKDIEDKDNTLAELRGSVKQFADKSQDLMRENISLKDLLQEFEKLTSSEVQQAHHQVHKELASCVSEIQYLIDLCSQIAEGQDPNISALLGIKGQAEAPATEDLAILLIHLVLKLQKPS